MASPKLAELIKVNLDGPGVAGLGLHSEDHLPLAVDQVQDVVTECREVVR